MPFFAIGIAVVIAAIDQVIKYFIAARLKPIGSVAVIDNLFQLTYVENRGVAFGMFKDMRWLFVVLTALMIAVILFYMFKKRPSSKLFYVCAGMIIGGGVGNLIDRVFNGYVIDYISLSFFPPVCNFADYCITIGVIILAVYILFFNDKFRKKKDIPHD